MREQDQGQSGAQLHVIDGSRESERVGWKVGGPGQAAGLLDCVQAFEAMNLLLKADRVSEKPGIAVHGRMQARQDGGEHTNVGWKTSKRRGSMEEQLTSDCDLHVADERSVHVGVEARCE